MKMLKNTFTAALMGVVLLSGVTASAEPRKPSARSERVSKETPYSNSAVRRQREIVRAIREAERTSRTGYQFKETGRRDNK